MQSGRSKSVVAIQSSLDGKQDVKRLLKKSSASVARHTGSQHVRLAMKTGEFEDFEIPVFRPSA